MALEYKLPYTGKEIEQKLNKVDDILYQITDPDNYPIGEIQGEDETQVITLEVGKLSRTSGNERDGEGGLRTPDFIAVNGGEKFEVIYEEMSEQGVFCFLLYDSSYTFIDTTWNGEYAYAYIESEGYLSIPSGIDAAYIKGYISVDNAEGSLTLIKKVLEPPKAEHKKIYMADHGYSIYGDIVDNPTMHKLVIKAEGKDNNAFNIVEIKAPSNDPREATLALMNWGDGNKQFVDFSSMTYDSDNPSVEIVCQTRGGEPLPEFSVRYNDGNGAGRVKKLTIAPDCIPIKLTSTGIEVRKNNNYDNNATAEELVTINLADLYDKVNLIYDALVANGTITTN